MYWLLPWNFMSRELLWRGFNHEVDRASTARHSSRNTEGKLSIRAYTLWLFSADSLAMNLSITWACKSALASAATLLALSGAPALAQDAAKGEQRAAMCIGCHGIPGYQASFPEVFRVPMISGQNSKYIIAALQAYRKGDRKHPTMRAIGGDLSDEDMANLGAFYEKHGASSIKPVSAAPAAQGKVAELLTKGACASCHGADYNKPIDGAYPKLAGQHADYLYAALRSYSVEGNRNVGRNNAIMAAQVKQFSRADLKLMAQYLASLPGELRTVPQSPLR
jgi:cytochrome c553